jgi:hypothetical protein
MGGMQEWVMRLDEIDHWSNQSMWIPAGERMNLHLTT